MGKEIIKSKVLSSSAVRKAVSNYVDGIVNSKFGKSQA
jgi:hypothetical protein